MLSKKDILEKIDESYKRENKATESENNAEKERCQIITDVLEWVLGLGVDPYIDYEEIDD